MHSFGALTDCESMPDRFRSLSGLQGQDSGKTRALHVGFTRRRSWKISNSTWSKSISCEPWSMSPFRAGAVYCKKMRFAEGLLELEETPQRTRV